MSDTAETAAHDSARDSASPPAAYRVLARKYRPTRFDELIGQDALVQTLTNALAMGRLAHAFVLTGLRGIGKTTTARIIASGLNCTGADGKGEPTLSPCGVCDSCKGIAAGRHVDVIEMDAASNTGVDDVREIIDGVGYRPLSSRYKIYIIDEVHMLSKSAFNALLKTLEEPPEAVKFIFATTEIRKVPVTVLSRCQRFDLRRVPADMLAGHLKNICGKESITAEDAALFRIARAAEGSVRDALSMLDQAAALTADNITDDAVASQLGQAGRSDALAITRDALAGNTADALAGMGAVCGKGAEPQMVLRDMLDLLHLAARLAAGGTAEDAPEAEAAVLQEMAEAHGLPRLVRAWQIALKGHGEIILAPDGTAAAEMVVIRLAHASTMPPPGELIRKLEKSPPATPPAQTATQTESKPAPESTREKSPEPAQEKSPAHETESETVAAVKTESAEAPNPAEAESGQDHAALPPPESLAGMAAMFEDHGEQLLAAHIRTRLRVVSFAPGKIEYAPAANIDAKFLRDIARNLGQWTGLRWVLIANETAPAQATLHETESAKAAAAIAKAREEPLVAATLAAFPAATIDELRGMDMPDHAALPADDDDDDDEDRARASGGDDAAHESAAHAAHAAIARPAR